MGRLLLSIHDSSLLDDLNDVPSVTQMSENLVITDQLSVPRSADGHLAFIGTDLHEIMRLLYERAVSGMLHPRDLRNPQLVTLAAGCRVFSVFSAEDLGVEPAQYRLIQQVVLGRTKRMASRTVGYSERQMRRILHQLDEAAGVGPDFRWSLLAPLVAQ